jgi:hypothetical protein
MRKEFEKGMSTLGNSTKRKLLSCILMIIQKFPTLQEDIPREIEDQYIDWQKVLSLKVTDEQNNREAKVIPTWKEYLTAVKKKYGENSKEFLVSLLYKRVPVRDDLYLKVIEKDGEQTDKDQNYIIIPKKGKCIVIINTYKTEKRYGANHKYDLDKITEMLLRKYIEKHNIIKNGFLWNEKKLSKFASTINKNIGIEGIEEGLGIKIYREMNVTEGIPENATPEQLVALARKMLHSVSSQDAYKRKHKT